MRITIKDIAKECGVSVATVSMALSDKPSRVSENTKKKFRNMCEYYHVPIYFYGMKDELGKAMGKEMRASLAVQDAGFAKAIEKILSDNA